MYGNLINSKPVSILWIGQTRLIGEPCFMKYLTCSLFLCSLFFSAVTVSAAEATDVNEADLLRAIEDYRFADLEPAIITLQKLQKQNPNDLRVLQYLGLSYHENGEHKKAIKTLRHWLRNASEPKSVNARFAWMSIARSQLQINSPKDASDTLNTWLENNPNDIEAKVLLADAQVKNKTFVLAHQTCDDILQNPDANNSQKAAAWYYKTTIAYVQIKPEDVKIFGNNSLKMDNEGPYAASAKQMVASPSAKTLGFYGNGIIEAFYNSNVELLPDIIKSTDGSGDNGIEGNVVLGWGLTEGDIQYVYSGTKHSTRSEFDITLHMLTGSWQYQDWRFSPSFETVDLNQSHLYQGVGFGVYYTQNDWTYHYSPKFKTFTDAFGENKVDLSRLGGSSHDIGASKSFQFNGLPVLFSSNIISEMTKGDDTHDKTDDYLQIGGNITTSIPLTDISVLNLGFNIYLRQYSVADSSILIDSTSGTKRNDTYSKLAANSIWNIWGNESPGLTFGVSYLTNNSNYDSGTVVDTAIKTYSSWKVSGGITGKW